MCKCAMILGSPASFCKTPRGTVHQAACLSGLPILIADTSVTDEGRDCFSHLVAWVLASHSNKDLRPCAVEPRGP